MSNQIEVFRYTKDDVMESGGSALNEVFRARIFMERSDQGCDKFHMCLSN